ncbi:MAG: hypothetical protein V3T05_01450, partial [Myxococcota bacterium]
MKRLPIGLLVAGLALPAASLGAALPSRHSDAPSITPAPAADDSGGVRVARRQRRSRRSTKKAPTVPVKVVNPGATSGTLKQGRKKRSVYFADPGAPLELQMSGAGKLALVIHQVLPAKKLERKKLTVSVSADGGSARTVTVLGRVLRKGSLEGGATSVVSNPKKHFEKLGPGDHTITVSVPEGTLGVAVRIEWYPAGFNKAAPVVVEPRKASAAMLAAIADLDDDDDDDIEAPPPPTTPPAATMVPIASVPPPEPPPSGPPPTEIAATPVAETPPTPQSLEEALAKRIAAGEVRDGLIGTWATLEVTHTRKPEKRTFHHVPEEKSFTVLVDGPGLLTIRLHRLIDPAQAANEAGKQYSVVILEDDVVLQQLSGVTELSQTWELGPSSSSAGLVLSEPKEYRLKVGNRKSKLALQISESADGMAIQYSFSAETLSLASMDLGFDDEDDEDEDIGPIAPVAPKPTVVMEVAVAERIIIEEKDNFIGFAAQAGIVVPAAGGDPVTTVGADVRFGLPFAGGAITVGAHAGYHRHTLQANNGETGAPVRVRSRTDSVPLFAKASYSLPLGESLAVYTNIAAGFLYIRASSRALGGT